MQLEDLLEKSKNYGWNRLKLFMLLKMLLQMIICYNMVNTEQKKRGCNVKNS